MHSIQPSITMKVLLTNIMYLKWLIFVSLYCCNKLVTAKEETICLTDGYFSYNISQTSLMQTFMHNNWFIKSVFIIRPSIHLSSHSFIHSVFKKIKQNFVLLNLA